VDLASLRELFDARVRQHPEPDGPATRTERSDLVIRVVSPRGGWSGVTWSDLDCADADDVIAHQIVEFASLGLPWEWKYYSHDLPHDLPDRLLAAGFRAGQPETVMVADLTTLAIDLPLPQGVRMVPVTTGPGLDALIAIHDAVFGGDHSGLRRTLDERLNRRPAASSAILALIGDTPVAGGRIDFHADGEFASLWGGGTLPAWRHRGVFHALVAQRGALAAAAGFRYLQVDATAASRPILRRLGFVELATTIPFIWPHDTQIR
jgi:hypothetical protein